MPKAKKIEVKKEKEVVPCEACNGTGLKDQNTLCPECHGHGQK